MARRQKITADERRHQDYLRRKGLKVGHVYETRLLKARAKEVRRVLALCQDVSNPAQWPGVINGYLDESSYLFKWFDGLYENAGLPMCKSTARDLQRAKAAAKDRDALWLDELKKYATARAGNNIVIVSGTLRETLIDVLRKEMIAEPGLGVEKLAKRVYDKYSELAKWQVRRIAQTESMVAMADAAAIASDSLDVAFTKQWCISGLSNTRDSHKAMDGIEVDQHDPFVLEGGELMYPHDGSLGADASEIINCACSCIRRPKTRSAQNVAEVSEPSSQAEQEAEAHEQRVKDLMKEMPKNIPEESRRAIAENEIAMEKALGVKKGLPMSIDKADKQSANSSYIRHYIPDANGPLKDYRSGQSYRINPDYSAAKNKPFEINCATCTPTYMMRLRGFDVTAKGIVSGSKMDYLRCTDAWDVWRNADGTKAKWASISEWAVKKDYKALSPARYKAFFEETCKEEGVYALSIGWRGSSGHMTILQRLADGRLLYIEPQVDNSAGVLARDIMDLCKKGNTRVYQAITRGIMRIDDKIFNLDYAEILSH